MQHYTLSQARRDFEIGYLTKWRIEKASMAEGWMIMLGEGMSAGYLSDARDKKPRVFKSLDGVINAIESVGFEVNALFQG